MQRLGFKRTTVRPSGEEVQAGYVNEYDTLALLEDARDPGSDDAAEVGFSQKPNDVPF
jgi:hypothetical protein